jgi:signal transduction histidine kinase
LVTVADDEQLEVALDALIDNAVKFTDPTDTIGVRTTVEGRVARVEVFDSGKGIPAADLPFVFDRFWKRARSGMPAGHGLGLSVVRAIVEAHGGTVVAENRPERGTNFVIKLPILPVDADDVAAARTQELSST